MNINFENKEEAMMQVKVLKDSYEEMCEVSKKQNEALKVANDQLESAAKTINTLTDAAMGTTEALKAVHTILGSKKDLWNNDKQINELMNSLSTFVLSSGAIKLGVISNDNNQPT